MPPAQPRTKVLYTFPSRTFIENIAIRPNGHVIFTTFREGSVFGLDPLSPNPEPTLIAQLPDASSLTGIVQIEPDVFVVTGGHQPRPMIFTEGTLKAFRVDLSQADQNVQVIKGVDVPGTEVLNGMAGIPENPHILLSLDSIAGRVFRINAKTWEVDIVLQDELLMPSEDKTRVPLGANGAKVRDGYLYFTNSGREVFCRVKIDALGNKQGDIEVLVSNEQATERMSYDDFDFDPEGVAYITKHSHSVFRVDRSWKQELFSGGTAEDSLLQSPTSLAINKDGRKMYVACAGKLGEFNGFIVEVEL